MLSKLAIDAQFYYIEEEKALPPALLFSHLGWTTALTCESPHRASTQWIFSLWHFLRLLSLLFPTPGASHFASCLPTSLSTSLLCRACGLCLGARSTRVGLHVWHVLQTLASAFCMPQRVLLYCFNGKSCSSEPQIHSSVRVVAGGIRR